IPRWPGPYGCSGSSNARSTGCGAGTGHCQRASPACALAGSASSAASAMQHMSRAGSERTDGHGTEGADMPGILRRAEPTRKRPGLPCGRTGPGEERSVPRRDARRARSGGGVGETARQHPVRPDDFACPPGLVGHRSSAVPAPRVQGTGAADHPGTRPRTTRWRGNNRESRSCAMTADAHGRAVRAQGRRTEDTIMAVVTMRQLLESGVHFGHQTRRWNPKVRRFIFTERNGIYIVDLMQTLTYIDKAYDFVKQTAAHGGTILFVGTKKQAQESVQEQATRVGMPYVNQRWLGGMLTNLQTVSARVNRLKELEQIDFED